MEEIISELRNKCNYSGMRNTINCYRDNVLDGGFRAFSRKSFIPEHGLNVRFDGEDAQDDGGPAREFLQLAVKTIANMGIFGGSSNHRTLTLDYAGWL